MPNDGERLTVNETVSQEEMDEAPVELPPSPKLYTQADYDTINELLIRVTNEKAEIDREKEELETKLAKAQRDFRADEILNGLIRPFANRIFWFMCIYCWFVAILIVNALTLRLITEKTILVLVGSTAVTVLGLVGTIVAGIFSNARHRS